MKILQNNGENNDTASNDDNKAIGNECNSEEITEQGDQHGEDQQDSTSASTLCYEFYS